MAVGHPHQNPFDPVDAREPADVKERGAAIVDAAEDKERPVAATVDKGKRRDGAASNPDNDVVADNLRDGVGDVEGEEVLRGVDEVLRGGEERLLGGDRLECLAERHGAVADGEV